MKHRGFLILLMVSAGILPVAAQEVLRLNADEAAALAIENNLNLKNTARDLEGSRRDWENVWNRFLPTINSSLTMNYQNRLFAETPPATSLPPTFSFLEPMFASPNPVTFVGNLSAELVIPSAIFTGIKVAKELYLTNQISYDRARQDMERSVRKLFYGLMVTQAGLDLLEQNIATLERTYAQTRQHYNNGLVSELDLLQAQVGLETLRPNRNQINATLAEQMMLFKFLLGIDFETPVELVGALDVEITHFDASGLCARYLNERQDVRLARQNVQMQDLLYQVERESRFMPSFILRGGWSTTVNDPYNGDRWKSPTWQDQWSGSLTIALPLDNFIPHSSGYNSVQAKQDALLTAQNNLDQALRNGEMEIINLVNKLENSALLLEAYELNVALAERAYRMSQEAYRLGTREYLEVENVRNNLLKVQNDVLVEKFNYLSNLLDLEFALNASLSEIITE
ncbi:MAG: TolC family protein [Spirochaetales bacterium]|jgi:outer membrane protein TolC|nr:TolC family protein [Spirochaetales bacterium]